MFDTQPPRRVGAHFTTRVFSAIGVDRYTVADCELGPVWVGWTARGVTAIRRAGSAVAEAAFADWYCERTGRRIVRAVEVDTIARAAQAKLRDANAADVPLDLGAATEFERAVLANVAQIRSGYARPYELLARDLCGSAEKPAIAAILAENAVPLLVPCHRVIHAERCCGGDYVFGASAQRQLLESEGLDTAAIDRVSQRGFRYIGSSDGYFCLPSCGDIARRVDEPGYMGLHSISEAQAHGLHACESCRPVAA